MQTKPRELRRLSWPLLIVGPQPRLNLRHKRSSERERERERERPRERGRLGNEQGSLNSLEGPVLLIVWNKTTGG